jgi:hypothetical protein
MAQWQALPLEAGVIKNVKESSLRGSVATLENAYVTEVKTISRFPQLKKRIKLPGENHVNLKKFRGDLYAVSGGRTYQIDTVSDAYVDRTEALINGKNRVIFADATDQLLMAAGGKIITLAGNKTKILSDEAPETTHVAYVNGYVIAYEPKTQRFSYSENGVYNSFPALNVLSAESKPGNIQALLVNDHGELLVAKEESIQQFDLGSSGSLAFFPRWTISSGVLAPYTLVNAAKGVWGLDNNKEFVSFSGQGSQPFSEEIQAKLEEITDFTDAWAGWVKVKGQRFIILQIPYATNYYGTEGATFALDYRRRKWYELYGWDAEKNLPACWAGWSIEYIGNKTFLGGRDGWIYELSDDDSGEVQQVRWRSGHLDTVGSKDVRIDRLRLRIKRGFAGINDAEPHVSIRINKNNKGFGRWRRKSLGKTGERDMVVQHDGCGTAKQFQFEIEYTDKGEFELVRFDALLEEYPNG